MSREEPKFGDVFRWTNHDFEQVVMYIAPGKPQAMDIWLGLTVATIGHYAVFDSEPIARLSLDDKNWTEVPE